jgi:glycerol-3-phosphate dehydrogenase
MRVARPNLRPSLADEHFHVAVIGGGINGVAVSRELARAGKRVVLLEQHDFASGTTSRATRIIHGGLRYLEHGEVGLVRESLRERDRLLRERPYLVRPLHFVLAIPKHCNLSKRGALAIRAGLRLYRWMSDEGSLRVSHRLEKAVDAGMELSVFDYEDAQCEFPERIVAEWLTEAAYAGTRVRNHAKVLDIKRSGHHFTIRLRDSLRKGEARIFADCVINASGPWMNDVCSRAFATGRSLIQGVRGSHIIINCLPNAAPSHAIYTEATDKRPFFIVPWNGQLLIGTTEVPDDNDPAEAKASDCEIQYLIDGFNRLIRSHQISRADVLAHYSGIRALPATGKHTDLDAVTRRSFIHDHRDDGLPGMYSLIGG